MHSQPPPAISTTHPAVTPSTTTSPTVLRIGSTLLLSGLVAEYVVTSLHPAHDNPNDHHAVFAEYAASDNWIAVHLGQFAAGLVVISGIITLLRALRPPTGPSLLARIAEAAAILTASAIAVLQGVDGFALKHAVDALASAPPGMQNAAFQDAEIVRWVEWSAAGYFRITLGLTVVLIGAAITRSRALPRWSGALALLAGLAFIADGVVVGTDGFTASVTTVVAWASFIVFAVTATAAAWWRRNNDPAAEVGDRSHSK
jgi:hypothetical protein